MSATTVGQAYPDAARVPSRLGATALGFVLLIDLVQSIFGGVLRYYLSKSGIPSVIYVPKFLIISAIIIAAMLSLKALRVRRSVIAITILFMAYILIGTIYTKTIIQVLFGAYILIQLYFGVLIAPILFGISAKLAKYALILWTCVALGVLYNYLSPVPWAGSNFTVGTFTMETSRQWSTFGFDRISGFSRASFAAASQLLLLALVVVVLGKNTILGVLVWLFTGALIVVTTTKTAMGVFLVVTILILMLKAHRLFPKLVHAIMVVVPVIMCAVGVVMPLSTLVVRYQLDLSSIWSGFLFASFGERLQNTWPDTLKLVFNHGSTLFGRGIGGVGMAQKFFEPTLYTPADNFFLYLYTSFGIVALYILVVYTRRVCSFSVHRQRWDVLMWLMGVVVLAEGWTVNVIEGSFLALALGITFAASKSNSTILHEVDGLGGGTAARVKTSRSRALRAARPG